MSFEAENQRIRKVVWTSDGRELLAAVAEQGPVFSGGRVVRVDVGTGKSSIVSAAGSRASDLTFLHSKSLLGYVELSQDTDIVRVVRPETGETWNTSPFANSTRVEMAPRISPNGDRVAFGSTRSGGRAIWVSSFNGMRAIQVSDVDDRSCGAPRWSPDGGRLAFDCSGTDGYQVFVSNADGGPSKQLTFGEPPSFAPSWSPDGQTVYFQRSGVPGLWMVGVEGGELEQLNQHRMARPVVSPDGEWAAFGEVGEDGAALWRASMRGGETVLLSDDIRTYSTAFDFAADGSIYYIENASGTDESTHLVKRWDPTTGLVREVTAIQGRLPRSYKFAIAPDGSWFLYVRESEPQSDLMVIEDFQ